MTWTKNEKPIKSDDHVKVSLKDGVSKVTIKKATEEDSAEYAITASNKGGKVYHALSIHVTKKEAPKYVHRPIYVIKYYNALVSISQFILWCCTFQAQDGATRVQCQAPTHNC